jgi:signal transduction histidine kinase
MVEECSELMRELLDAKTPAGEPLLDAHRRERAQLCLVLLEGAREELAANQKFASLGRLAAAVLHDLLNPLAFIQTNIDVLAADLPALLAGDASKDQALADDTKGLVEDSRVGIERISAALSAVRILLREESGRTRGDLRRAAEAASRLFAMRVPPGVRFDQDLREVPAIACGDGLAGQVLVHLLLRAVDAVGNQGRIALRLSNSGNGEVIAEVEHTGADAPEKQHLGFSLAQHLVARAGGTLQRNAAEGPGARYVVRLPAAPGRD